MAVSAAVAAAVFTGASVIEQRKSGRRQERSQKIAQRKADVESARGRRQQIREARIRRADILQASASTGAAGSSAETGAIGSLQSQLGTNLGASFQTQALSQSQSRANIGAAKASTRAGIFGSVADITSPFADFKSIFKG